MTAEEVDKIFAEVDEDGDGKLDFAAFAALMKGTSNPAPNAQGTLTNRPSGRHNKLRELTRAQQQQTTPVAAGALLAKANGDANGDAHGEQSRL
jgi:hypothetical protein